MFCLTTINNNDEFMNYNTGFEFHLQTANTHMSYMIHIQHPQYYYLPKTPKNYEFQDSASSLSF